MEFKDLIMARRSVRAYEEGIGHEALVSILKEAQRAPSWKNQQTSRCYAVETPATLEELRGSALPSFNQNSSAHATLVVTTFVRDTAGFSEGRPVNAEMAFPAYFYCFSATRSTDLTSVLSPVTTVRR